MNDQPVTLFGGMRTQQGRTISSGIARSARRDMEQVAARTEVAIVEEQATAFVAAQMMTNVTTLLTQAQAHMKIAPEGAQFYEMLITGYALGAGQRLGRFS